MKLRPGETSPPCRELCFHNARVRNCRCSVGVSLFADIVTVGYRQGPLLYDWFGKENFSTDYKEITGTCCVSGLCAPNHNTLFTYEADPLVVLLPVLHSRCDDMVAPTEVVMIQRKPPAHLRHHATQDITRRHVFPVLSHWDCTVCLCDTLGRCYILS